MVDARLRGEWLTAPAHDRLSDPAYRVLHNALMYCAEQGTDGHVETRAIRYLYPGPVAQAWLDELEAAGFWVPVEDGFHLFGWDTVLGQSTAAEVERQRERNRRKQAAYRERVAATSHVAVAAERDVGEGEGAAGASGVVSSEVVTGYVTGVVGKARQGPSRALPALEGVKGRRRRHDCAVDGHELLDDGTCTRCEYRDRDHQRAS